MRGTSHLALVLLLLLHLLLLHLLLLLLLQQSHARRVDHGATRAALLHAFQGSLEAGAAEVGGTRGGARRLNSGSAGLIGNAQVLVDPDAAGADARVADASQAPVRGAGSGAGTAVRGGVLWRAHSAGADGRLVQGQAALARSDGGVVGAGHLHGAAVAAVSRTRRDFHAIALDIRAGHVGKLGRAHGRALSISTAFLILLLVVAGQAEASGQHVGSSGNGSASAWLLDADQRVADLGVQLGSDLRGDVGAGELLGALVGSEARGSDLLTALGRNRGSHVLVHPQRAARARVDNALQVPISRVARGARGAGRGLGRGGAFDSGAGRFHFVAQLQAALALRDDFLLLVQHAQLALVAAVRLAFRCRGAVACQAGASPLRLLHRALSLEESVGAAVGVARFAGLAESVDRGGQHRTARANFLGANQLFGDGGGQLSLHGGRDVVACIVVGAVSLGIANLQGSGASAGRGAHIHGVPSPLACALILDAHQIEVAALLRAGSAVGGSHVRALNVGAHISGGSHLALVSHHHTLGVLDLQTARVAGVNGAGAVLGSQRSTAQSRASAVKQPGRSVAWERAETALAALGIASRALDESRRVAVATAHGGRNLLALSVLEGRHALAARIGRASGGAIARLDVAREGRAVAGSKAAVGTAVGSASRAGLGSRA